LLLEVVRCLKLVGVNRIELARGHLESLVIVFWIDVVLSCSIVGITLCVVTWVFAVIGVFSG
jgi:hypothetical protein